MLAKAIEDGDLYQVKESTVNLTSGTTEALQPAYPGILAVRNIANNHHKTSKTCETDHNIFQQLHPLQKTGTNGLSNHPSFHLLLPLLCLWHQSTMTLQQALFVRAHGQALRLKPHQSSEQGEYPNPF